MAPGRLLGAEAALASGEQFPGADGKGAGVFRHQPRSALGKTARPVGLHPRTRSAGVNSLRWSRCFRLALAQRADVVRVDKIGYGPAVEVVFGHALVGKALPPLVWPRADRRAQGVDANFLMAAGVVDLVELVAGAELAADRVP